jgi:hypothetical protein
VVLGHAEDLYATVSAGLARSRCPALARKLNCHPARKKARTILPSFLPSFLLSQSPTAKPSLSPSEDPTKGSSCRPKQSAARVQASFVPESDRKTVRGFYLSTYVGHSCARLLCAHGKAGCRDHVYRLRVSGCVPVIYLVCFICSCVFRTR